jgi:hypothetical protein
MTTKSWPKGPRQGSGWKHAKTPPNRQCAGYERHGLFVISEVGVMEAPDGSKDSLETWLVSVSRRGASMPNDKDVKRVRRDFDMRQAEENNHFSGISRALFLVVDPARRVECECKTTERVIVRVDGYRYSVPAKDAAQE